MSSSTQADRPRAGYPDVRATGASEAAKVEHTRAVAEVAGAVRIAQERPRDEARAIERMRRACSQRALADRAFWSLPRGGKKLEGSSVHLARELATCWGNIDHGVRETRRDDAAGQSEVLAWAWDQETNVRSSRSFVVPHARMARGSREPLVDLTDVANNNNSVAARAVRETIWHVLPVWYRVEAEERCHATLNADADADGRTFEQQVADVIAYFGNTHGASRTQLEVRVDRPAAQWTPQTLGFLRVLDSELKRGEKLAADEFPVPGVSEAQVAAATSRRARPAEPPAEALPPGTRPDEVPPLDDADVQAQAEYAAEQARQPSGLFGTDEDGSA